MLVLSRKPNEIIKIGDDIILRVLEIKGDTVRIGIEAPKSTEILRGELILATSETNMESNQLNNDLFTKLTKET